MQSLLVNWCLPTLATGGVCYLLHHFFFIVRGDALLCCFPGHETYKLVVTFIYMHVSERTSLRVKLFSLDEIHEEKLDKFSLSVDNIQAC